MALDYETDTIIQTSLRTELGKDVTLLTVAHRLQTIMDSDKIVSCSSYRCNPSSYTDHSHVQMVLNAGHIVSPSLLLRHTVEPSMCAPIGRIREAQRIAPKGEWRAPRTRRGEWR